MIITTILVMYTDVSLRGLHAQEACLKTNQVDFVLAGEATDVRGLWGDMEASYRGGMGVWGPNGIQAIG